MITPEATVTPDGKRRAISLVTIMILASWLPMGTPWIAIAHAGVVAEWGSEGSNDTGWIQLNATLPNSLAQSATADLMLDFAPGAAIDNLTFEIRVNGSDGIWVEEPQILLPDAPASLLDWRGLGALGQQNNFIGSDPHTSRLSPNSDSNAGWVLPGGATITDVVIEALRPADPLVSMQRIEVNVADTDIHPIDGRLYWASGDSLVQVDSQNNPPVIEVFDLDQDILAISVDSFNNIIYVASRDENAGYLHVYSLIDSSYLGEVTTPGLTFSALADGGFGGLWASDGDGLYSGNFQLSMGTPMVTWTRVVDLAVGANHAATDIMVLSTDVWISTDGSGLYHYDASSGAANHYDTQNALPSDRVIDLEMAGSHLLIATADSGVSRRDVSTNSWLATWTNGNWLASNSIASLSSIDGWVHILAGDTIHAYNTTSLSFTNAWTMTDLSLSREVGDSLIPWPHGGSRSPSNHSVLVGDSSGTFAVLHPSLPSHGISQGSWDQMIFATGPSEDQMRDAIELNGIIYIAAGEKVERFDMNNNRWLNPLTGNSAPYSSAIQCIATDGTNIFIGSESSGVIMITINGTTVISENAAQWVTADGLSSSEVGDLAYESATGQIISMHPFAGISVIDPTNSTVPQTWTEFNGLNSNDITALAVRGGIAYAGTNNDGVERIDIVNSTLLTPWTSTGMDDVDAMPIAIDGSTLYLGMYGFGVLVYDMSTGEQTGLWQRTGGNGPGQSNQIPSNNVLSLAILTPGTVLVGTNNGGAQHTSSGWSNMGNTGNERADQFYDWDFDNQHIYAATETGVCQWTRSGLQFQKCWDDNPDGLPGEDTYAIELIEPNRIWVGQNEGAGVIDVTNDSVIKSWEAGVNSGNAKVIVIGDVAYLGYDGIGILRYDLVTDEWLSPWDAVTSNLIESNGVTAMVQDINPNRIWVGGDMGLNLIDVVNATLEKDWDSGSNSGGITLSNQEPGELVIVGDTMYYMQVRFGNNGYSSNDNIYRYDIINMTQLSTLDVGNSEGYSALVHGMGAVGDIIHFGISPTNWWQGDGHMVRWNHTSGAWMDSIEAKGQVERVNAQFAGDCNPTPTNCHLYAAYGNTPLHQVDMNGNLVRSWDDSVLEGPIRGIATWDGTVLFGTEDGISRYNYSSNTWLSEWTSNNGLPNNVEDAVYSMETIGDDLWVSTMATSGWNRNSKILQLNGTSNQWTVHDVGSGQVPEGYGADIGICNDIVHVALNRWAGWGSQGGVARYDLSTGNWLSDWNQGAGGLPHDNPVAIACDDAYQITYIGFEEDDGSIARYDYVNQQFLATLDEDDNVVSEPIFPGAMQYQLGSLLVGHYDGGGITYISTTGQIVTAVIPFSTDAEATSIDLVPGQTFEFAVGRAGGASGYNRVDNLNGNGLNPGAWDNLATLSTGRIAEFTGNSTHIWAVPIDDFTSTYGTAILEGEYQSNGSIEWTRAWNLNAELVNEITLDGNTLWITTTGLGLHQIDLVSGNYTFTGYPLHGQMDGLTWYGNELIVGLMGTPSTAAGVQRYDTSTGQWGAGRISAGLPSNFVRDFEKIGDLVYIATLAGIGVWNLSADDWEDPMTTADGLPTPFITHLDSDNGILLIGTPSGLMSYEPGLGLGQMYGRNQGLVGDSVNGIAKIIDPATGITTLFVSHNGEGPTRPGFSEVVPVTPTSPPGVVYTVLDTTLVDILPSNGITALASDWWGIHIGTDAEPLMHWNASGNEMEQGVSISGLSSWPIQHMDSDGQNIIAISSMGVDLIDVTTGLHPSTQLISYAGLSAGTISSNGVYIVGMDGLHVWSGHPSFIEIDRSSMRRADPLTITLGGSSGSSLDATDEARPGNKITLINSSNAVSIPAFGTAGPGNIPVTQDMLTLSSPVSGAATWVASTRLNYSGSWDLAALNSNLQTTVQVAIDNSVLTSMGRSLHIQLQSPVNGSLEVRLTYDWVRTESPSEMIDLFDRPEDGGGTLIAQWTVTQDHSFNAYQIYLRPNSNWTSAPTSSDLLGTTWDGRYTNWQRDTIELNSHAGQPLIDGVPYWAVVVIEYPDGTIGEPSDPIGPAIPTNEIPMPPEWANAGPFLDGDDGDLFIEWSPCTELDADVTRIWASPTPISNAVGLLDYVELANDAGNNTSLSLEEGRPYWVALTCVDESGQHDPENATIVGPVVPTGGIDDGIAPDPVSDIAAWDTPDDEGGRINVSWTPNTENDCAWYTIFATPVVSEEPPLWADDAEIAAIVPDCEINGTIISKIGESIIIDQQLYWITVVASDKWGNVDHFNLTWVSVFSVQDNLGINPPPRVEGLMAWDHPDDDGTAVDVEWTPTGVDDFAFYVVWASEQPLNDVAIKWVECIDDPSACGLMQIPQQSQTFDGQMQIVVETALYGETLETSTPSEIIPGKPIWITVTIHDIKGNAFLTRLSDHMVLVTPIDNSADQIAPDRIEGLEVEDRPNDNGDGLWVWFEESQASDIDHYEIYADGIPFGEVGIRPVAMNVSRDTPQPIELESRSGGIPITPGVMLWITVVPVDTAGNAWRTNLNDVNAMPVNNSLEDPGLHLPEVLGINASWNGPGTDVVITWNETRDPQVQGYYVHISDEEYVDNRFALLVTEDYIQNTRLTMNATTFDLVNNQVWYVSVVVSDGQVNRFGVESVMVPVWQPGQASAEDEDLNEEGSGAWWQSLSVMEIALLAILAAMIALLSLILVVRLRKPRYDPLKHATPNWELQLEDWSGDDGTGTPMTPEVDFADTLIPAASSIESTPTVATTPSSVDSNAGFAPRNTTPESSIDDLANDLLGNASSKGDDIDTSFLDDLL